MGLSSNGTANWNQARLGLSGKAFDWPFIWHINFCSAKQGAGDTTTQPVKARKCKWTMPSELRDSNICKTLVNNFRREPVMIDGIFIQYI